MPELTLCTFRAEGQQTAAAVRPPGPAFDDRPSLVSVTATLGAQHRSNVGALTADRRARHGNRLRLVCPQEKSRPAIGADLRMRSKIAGSPIETASAAMSVSGRRCACSSSTSGSRSRRPLASCVSGSARGRSSRVRRAGERGAMPELTLPHTGVERHERPARTDDQLQGSATARLLRAWNTLQCAPVFPIRRAVTTGSGPQAGCPRQISPDQA